MAKLVEKNNMRFGKWYHNPDKIPKEGISSAIGMKSFADLPDCPECKYGTLETKILIEGEIIIKCIDCGYITEKSF